MIEKSLYQAPVGLDSIVEEEPIVPLTEKSEE